MACLIILWARVNDIDDDVEAGLLRRLDHTRISLTQRGEQFKRRLLQGRRLVMLRDGLKSLVNRAVPDEKVRRLFGVSNTR